MDWQVARAAFVSHLQLEGLSSHTVAAYERDLAILQQSYPVQPPASLTREQLARELARLAARGLNGKSLSRALSAWRRFFSFISQKEAISDALFLGLKAPKSAKRLPKALPVDKAMHLLDESPGQGDERLIMRDQAMFELMYSGGLRLAELCALDLSDLSLNEGLVRVMGKGKKARLCQVGSQAAQAICAWLEARQSLNAGEALFVSLRGTRLGARQVQNRLASWAAQAGMDRRVHPHMLRHSFASHILQSSGDLRAVQEMLGHANLSSTQIYTAVDFQHLAQVYDKAHPRAHKKD
ncbi:tyrosine recombinase XerC [Craterilacuibacter sinensis]|uniref:Tyrosine recombinase XerC n=1 Tax=Craterilacuibacter sinensis TaxID=2686017 RepID=A0A845BZB9_9NEIS|nr:tyrosine recombinase XerC [Craterilacuibacter sinensis]MXR37853.1 tyrosine-type recombinase/integrase [Craterilacuibacter sinensis]